MVCPICSIRPLHDVLSGLKVEGFDSATWFKIDKDEILRKASQGGLCDLCYPIAEDARSSPYQFYEVRFEIRVAIEAARSFWRLVIHGKEWLVYDSPIHLIERDPMGSKAFGHVLGWIARCNKSHTQCHKKQPDFMPSRLLDVGDSESHDVRIVSGPSQRGNYVALSHCWGASQPLSTTTATLPNFQISIDTAQLPGNFSDAIDVTRRLGIQYLWIDSLCIIQDDPKDWAREAATMAQVYSNAEITVIASRSSCCTDGFLSLRTTEKVVEREELTAKRGKQTLYLSNRRYGWGHPTHFIKQDPLSNRAWTLQERWLSRRTIMFSQDQIVWECKEMTASEHDPHRYVPRLTAELNWKDLVESYTSRAITYEKDTLPAIAGIARTVGEHTGDTYCVGVWVENLSSLLWHPSSGGPITSRGLRMEYIAPTFSWAALAGPVSFLTTRWEFIWLVKYIAHGQERREATTDSYGAVKSAWLKLGGPLIRVTRAKHRDLKDGRNSIDMEVRLEGGSNYVIQGTDDMDKSRTPYRNLDDANMFLLPICSEETSDSPPRFIQGLYCMMLSRVSSGSGPPRFRRIGLSGTFPEQLTPTGDKASGRNILHLFLDELTQQKPEDVVLI
ncbi:heterokaryon incompatibility protein-domain-containing protein [Hypoxylon argillaceum]|nr:heterokaryon incompatibility protein-domain-containing protein [Hypoxylon argillaceum]